MFPVNQHLIPGVIPGYDSDEERYEKWEHFVRYSRMMNSRKQRSGPQGTKRKFSTSFSWSEHADRLNPAEFRMRYRLTLESFNKLKTLLLLWIETKNKKQAACTRPQGEVVPEVCLAIALRYFSGGMVDDLALIYHVSKQGCMNCVWKVVDGLNQCPELAFKMPSTEHDFEVLERDFREAHNRRYPSATGEESWVGQIGAIDGIDIAMKNPGKNVEGGPSRYYVGRKGGYMLLCIAICDEKRRFWYMNISKESQTHDSAAWDGTALGQKFLNGSYPNNGYFICGDNAFTNSPNMITPMNDSDFDFYQSSNRMAIECAFGILVRRWGLLWRPLECRFDRRAKLIMALMIAHNFCINERIEQCNYDEEISQIQPGVWVQTPDFANMFTNGPVATPTVAEPNSVRDELKDKLSSAGLVRPTRSAYSRAMAGHS